MRSDRLPHIGANKNCIAENDDISRINIGRDAANTSPYRGRTGITIPNPSRSMNTTRKTTNRLGLLVLAEVGVELSVTGEYAQ